MYDPQIGRFGEIDALAGATAGSSPYNFGMDNAVMFNDPGGKKAEPKSGFSTYSPTEQAYINGLADPMGHGSGNVTDFMGSVPSDGGEEINLSGAEAQVYFAALQKNIISADNQDNANNPFPIDKLFNTSNLSSDQLATFTANINNIYSTSCGQLLLNQLLSCGQMINVENVPTPQSTETANYSFDTNTLNMNTLLSDDNWSSETIPQATAHELYHAFQDFSGLPEGHDNEPDAYIFTSLFDRQYGMSDQWYNMTLVKDPTTSSQTNYQNSWNNFFINGYSNTDYQGIYQNFWDGSSEQGMYKDAKGNALTGPINPNSRGYLIYQFLQ